METENETGTEKNNNMRNGVLVGLAVLCICAAVWFFFYRDKHTTTPKTEPAQVKPVSESKSLKVLDLPQDDEACKARCGQTLKRNIICVNATTREKVDISLCAGLPDPENIPLQCPKCSWNRVAGKCSTDCGTGTRKISFACNEQNPSACGQKPADIDEACKETSACTKTLVDGVWVWTDGSTTVPATPGGTTTPTSGGTTTSGGTVVSDQPQNVRFADGVKPFETINGKTTKDSCWRYCAENDKCDWAVQSDASTSMIYMNTCQLFQSSTPPSIPTDSSITALSKAGSLKLTNLSDPRCTKIAGYQCQPGEVFRGNEIDRLANVTNATQCSDLCTKYGADCTFFSHSRPYGTCYLKSTKVNVVRTGGDEATYTKYTPKSSLAPSSFPTSTSPSSHTLSFRGWL